MTIRNLLEEFAAGGKTGYGSYQGEYYEIFKNPTTDELEKVSQEYSKTPNFKTKKIETYREARGLIDNENKIVYVFSPELYHERALDILRENNIKFKKEPLRVMISTEAGYWKVYSQYKDLDKESLKWIEEKTSIKL